jgi:hypothetical protein
MDQKTQEKMLKLYKSLEIKDLRKRQDLCHIQLEMAFEQKNDNAVENLYTMSGLLTEAIMFVEFGE